MRAPTRWSAPAASSTARGSRRSEHFVAYVYEWLTNEHRVHGELIAFSVLVMSCVQGNDPDRAVRIVRSTKVDARPEHVGIGETLLTRIFAELPAYCERERLFPSVVEVADLTPELARAAFALATAATRI